MRHRNLIVGLNLVVVAFTLLIVIAANASSLDGHHAFLSDWLTYANAADKMLHGRSPFDPAQLAGPYYLPHVTVTGYSYPPPSALLFVPFSSGAGGAILFVALNAALLATGVYAILRKELGDDAPLLVGIAFGALLLFPGTQLGLLAGNASVGLAGLVAWAWVLGRGGIPAAVTAGAALTKLVPGMLIFWTRPSGFVRAVVETAGWGIMLCLVALPITGFASWFDFVRAMNNALPMCPLPGALPSLACVVQPVAGLTVAKLFGFVIGCGLGIAAVRARSDLVSFSLVTAAWLAAVTDLHTYTLIPAVVLGILLVAKAMRRSIERRAAPAERLVPAAETS